MSRVRGHGAILQSMSMTIIMQNCILATDTAADKHILILDVKF